MRHMRHMHHAAAEICKASKPMEDRGGLMEHKWKMVWLNQYSSGRYGD